MGWFILNDRLVRCAIVKKKIFGNIIDYTINVYAVWGFVRGIWKADAHIFLSFFFLPDFAVMAKLSTLLNLMIFLWFRRADQPTKTLWIILLRIGNRTGQSVNGLYL